MFVAAQPLLAILQSILSCGVTIQKEITNYNNKDIEGKRKNTAKQLNTLRFPFHTEDKVSKCPSKLAYDIYHH